MIKQFIVGSILALGITSGVKAEFFYPIQEMSKPECRFQEFSSLGSDCKQALPILKTSDYSRYKNDYGTFRRVYTVLWGASYKYGWDAGYGGHSGVDIATARGTPVYSMTSGKVVFAGNLSGRGNTVKIEHNHNGRKIYSNYSHLSKIDVSVGDSVTGKQKIGEVGSTGNSTGNHLHFQIDMASSGRGPRYRSNCSEKNYDNIVNNGTCFDQLSINTIDPLRFLETNGSVVTGGGVVEKPQVRPPVFNPETILSREEILKREIEEFLKFHDVKIQISGVGGNMTLGKSSTVRVSVTDKRTRRPFTGAFPGDMNFKYSKNAFDIFPTGILQIENGVRDFKITPKLEGRQTLEIYLGETFFKKLTFGVFDTKKQIRPASVVFGIKRNSVISQNSKGILYFRNNYGLNIIGVPFSGTFTFRSPSQNIKFCIKPTRNIQDIGRQNNANCKEESFTFEQTIRSVDAAEGILLFDFKVMNQGVNTIQIIDNSNGKEVGNFKVNGTPPLGLQVTHPYYEEIMKLAGYAMIPGMSGGFALQDRELNREDGVNFIRNYLEFKRIGCRGNQACINEISANIVNLSREDNSRFTNLSRIDFVEMLYKYSGTGKYNGESMDFRDLSDIQKSQVKDILKGKTWKDVFGQTRYFQPNKNITRGEAMYLIYLILP